MAEWWISGTYTVIWNFHYLLQPKYTVKCKLTKTSYLTSVLITDVLLIYL